MVTVSYIILGVVAAVLAPAVATGLWRMVRALLAGDVALARRLALPLLRLGLWLAGAVIIVASHGRSYRIAYLLNVAAMLLQLLRDWPILKASRSPSRDEPAA